MAILGAIAVAGIGAAVLLPALSKGSAALPLELVVVVGVGVALVVALFFVANAVMHYKLWGRYAGIAYGLLSLLGFPLGTLVGGYVLWQLVFAWADGAQEA